MCLKLIFQSSDVSFAWCVYGTMYGSTVPINSLCTRLLWGLQPSLISKPPSPPPSPRRYCYVCSLLVNFSKDYEPMRHVQWNYFSPRIPIVIVKFWKVTRRKCIFDHNSSRRYLFLQELLNKNNWDWIGYWYWKYRKALLQRQRRKWRRSPIGLRVQPSTS